MTYKLLRHKDFTAEWEKLPSAIRDQFKKKLAKVIEQPHIPKNMLKGDLAGCYKIKLLKAGVRLVYQVKDDQVVILLITVGKRADSIVYDEAKKADKRLKMGAACPHFWLRITCIMLILGKFKNLYAMVYSIFFDFLSFRLIRNSQ